MIKVLKASGALEDFSEEKLKDSLIRAGASDVLARWVTAKIEQKIRDRMKTSEIHERAFDLLRKEEHPFAARYQLKRAIMELGPTGHPFEKFVAWILKGEGYETQTNITIRGKCVTHEVDIVAKKEGRQIMVEAKYHNEPGVKSDVKVAMYIRSRFEDIKGVDHWDEAWLITNTKLTSDAREYSACAGLTAIAWNYPYDRSLQYLIEKEHLYPLTSLLTLDHWAKHALLEKGFVLVKEVTDQNLAEIGVKASRREGVLRERDITVHHGENR